MPADAAAILFGGDFRQERIVELQARLIRGVGDDEQERRHLVRPTADERRAGAADDRAPHEKRHPSSCAIGHRAKQRRHDEDDAHRDRRDDAVDAVGALRANLRRGRRARSRATPRPSRRWCWRGRRGSSSRLPAWESRGQHSLTAAGIRQTGNRLSGFSRPYRARALISAAGCRIPVLSPNTHVSAERLQPEVGRAAAVQRAAEVAACRCSAA